MDFIKNYYKLNHKEKLYRNLWASPIFIIIFIILGYLIKDLFCGLIVPICFTIASSYVSIKNYKKIDKK